MRRIVFGFIVAIVLAGAVARAQEQGPPSPTAATAAAAAPSDVEKLTRQLNDALDQLAFARASRGDCESTLAPIEAQARRADSEQRWADQKAAMEKARGGLFECNPRTGECTKKPAPPKAPAPDIK